MWRKVVFLLVVILLTSSIANLLEAQDRSLLSLSAAIRLHFISILGQTATLSSSHGLFRLEPIKNLGLRFGIGTMSLKGLEEKIPFLTEIPTPLPDLLIIDLSILYLNLPLYIGAGVGLVSTQGIGITTFQGFAGLELKLIGPLSVSGEAQMLVASAMGIGVTIPSIGFGVGFGF